MALQLLKWRQADWWIKDGRVLCPSCADEAALDAASRYRSAA